VKEVWADEKSQYYGFLHNPKGGQASPNAPHGSTGRLEGPCDFVMVDRVEIGSSTTLIIPKAVEQDAVGERG
jgi:hypothetical protein